MIERTLFNADHEAFRDSFARFIDKEIAPFHAQWEEQGYVDREVWRKAGANGFLCMTMPEEYGGAGADKLYSVLQMEALSGGNYSGIGFGLHNEIVAPYILRYGTEAQKRKYLPLLASGEMVGAIAMSEPAAGSDLQGVKSTAVLKGDHYLLNGSKTFITNGWHADLVIVVAKTNPEAGAKGTSLLLVERGMPGFERGKRLKKVGLKAQDTSELFFDSVKVPAENLLGGADQLNRGFIGLMEQLPWERLQIAIGAVANMQATIEQTIAYVNERKVFGQAVASLPEHALEAGGTADRGAGGARLRRQMPGAVAGGQARHRHRIDGQVLVLRPAEQGHRRMCAAVRRLRLHVGVPGGPRLGRRPCAAHLRRHQRDHEGSDQPFARPRRTQVTEAAAPALRRPRGRPRKTADERDEGNRRQELLQHAARLFRLQGYAATTTRDIAAAAGMRAGSPFYHFESKAALLFAVMEQGMRGALQRQAAAVQAVPARAAPQKMLRGLVRAHFDVLLGPGSDFIPVMLYEWRSLKPAQRDQISKLQRDYEAAWADALQALSAAGSIRADARVARLMMLGALNWSVQWYKPKQGASLDELTEQAMLLFLP